MVAPLQSSAARIFSSAIAFDLNDAFVAVENPQWGVKGTVLEIVNNMLNKTVKET